VNHNLNYDNIINAMELLFSMSLVDWVYQAFIVVDATGIDMQPKLNASIIWQPFFVMFMMLFSFFLLNLFVGVVVITYNEQKEKMGKNFLLSER